jgi:AcrR family transcriptional regulator
VSSEHSGERRRLDRATVVDAAIEYADARGLDALSMRRLAESVGVSAMALYKHVSSREELLDAMVEQVVERIPPSEAGEAWVEALRARILAARDALGRHPWAQSAIETRATAGPAVLGYMDDLMGIMFAGGCSADLVHHAMHALSTRMWGFTRDVLPTPTMPADPDQYAQALAAYQQQYPAIVRMASSASGAGAGCDADAEFAFALDIMVESFERLRVAGWSSDAGTGSHGR